MSDYNASREIRQHVAAVKTNLTRVYEEVASRAARHDSSKLEPEELDIFNTNMPILMYGEEDSPEFNNAIQEIKRGVEIHWRNNPGHHPEGNKDGIEDMSLIDLIEWVCDLKAYDDQTESPNFERCLELRLEKYRIEGPLAIAIANFASQMKWIP